MGLENNPISNTTLWSGAVLVKRELKVLIEYLKKYTNSQNQLLLLHYLIKKNKKNQC